VINSTIMVHFDTRPTFETEINRRLHSGGREEYFVLRPKEQGEIGDVSIFLSRDQLKTIRDSIDKTLQFWEGENG
jgi:hypothetical protein